MAKFGDVGREPSDNQGHFAVFMYIGPSVAGIGDEGFYLDDDDPIDKSLIGGVHLISSHGSIEWLDA